MGESWAQWSCLVPGSQPTHASHMRTIVNSVYVPCHLCGQKTVRRTRGHTEMKDAVCGPFLRLPASAVGYADEPADLMGRSMAMYCRWCSSGSKRWEQKAKLTGLGTASWSSALENGQQGRHSSQEPSCNPDSTPRGRYRLADLSVTVGCLDFSAFVFSSGLPLDVDCPGKTEVPKQRSYWLRVFS